MTLKEYTTKKEIYLFGDKTANMYSQASQTLKMDSKQRNTHTHTDTHTHIYIYI